MNAEQLGLVFYSRQGFYPSFSNFMNAVKDKYKDKIDRDLLKKYYFAQEIVQVFAPPPLQEALKRKEGYYPKIISFFPFERLYCDTGKIRIFEKPRKQEKEKVDKTADYDKNIKQNGEDKFPEDLRWVYPSGIKKSGNKGGNKMPDDLIQKRDEFIVSNPNLFSGLLVKNAQKRIDKKTT